MWELIEPSLRKPIMTLPGRISIITLRNFLASGNSFPLRPLGGKKPLLFLKEMQQNDFWNQMGKASAEKVVETDANVP